MSSNVPKSPSSHPSQDDIDFYNALNHYTGVIKPSLQAVDYRDTTPKPFTVQIPLVEYFERTKRLKADRWQKHFCEYLQAAVENRHIKPTFAEFHAQAQAGKTSILSQAFPAWCLGHDPLFRTSLAMYNISRAQAHSQVVIQMMQSDVHKDIFPDPAGHLPKTVSKAGWSTNARTELNDGQFSFNPVGLISGLTGSGFDVLIVDDPYAQPADAFSETMFQNLERFWQMGVLPRLSAHSCIAAMFHRYAYDDFGGYLLNTGKFDYVRYASIADGPYVHEETGQRFDDPLGREPGELLSPERFPASYYENKSVDAKTWNSMFQGRPSAETGDFFDVSRLGMVADPAEWDTYTLRARGWDHAATQGAGDRSAGGLMGIAADGSVIVADIVSAQVNTADRVALQRATAEADGIGTTVVIPEERAAAGKDVVFMMQKELDPFHVVARPVTNASSPGADAKKRRAHNFSVAVNSGKVRLMPDTEANRWNERLKRLMRNFGASMSGDDEIDALSDAYNHLYESLKRGRVLQSYGPHDLMSAEAFADLVKLPYPNAPIPANYTVWVGLRVTADTNAPNAGVVVVRPPDNVGLPDTMFVVAAYKSHTGDVYDAFTWLEGVIRERIDAKARVTVWMHPASAEYRHVVRQKLATDRVGHVGLFANVDETAGVSEMNWYAKERVSGVTGVSGVRSGLQFVGDDVIGIAEAEALVWRYSDKGKPNGMGAVLDCLRMMSYAFRTVTIPLTVDERVEAALPERLRADVLREMPADDEAKDTLLTRRRLEVERVRDQVGRPKRGGWATRFAPK